MQNQIVLQRRFQIMDVFRPSAPISDANLFAGRQDEIVQLLDAIAGVGRHAILYGERGVGKTSLTSILGSLLPPQSGIIMIKVNCDREDTFTEIWMRVLGQIQLATLNHRIGFGEQVPIVQKTEPIASAFAGRDISPDDIRILFQQLNLRAVVIIDEIDKIEDRSVKGLLADAVKALSDHASATTLILVGVADSVDELIRDHLSIARAIQQVQMKRMTTKELREALQKCLTLLEMEIEPEAEANIVMLSSGLPHYTHLLGQHSALVAAESGRSKIIQADFQQAINRALINTEQTTLRAYVDAIRRYRSESIHPHVLLACALTEKDELGYFQASEIKKDLTEMLHKKFEISHFARMLSDFSSDKRGNILERSRIRKRYFYRFRDPLMQPFIIMKGIQDELISYDQLRGVMDI